MLAAIQAPIILMSQNRQAQKDRLVAEHDDEVNLEAELETMLLHEKIERLREDQWAALLAIQQEQIGLLAKLLLRQSCLSGKSHNESRGIQCAAIGQIMRTTVDSIIAFERGAGLVNRVAIRCARPWGAL